METLVQFLKLSAGAGLFLFAMHLIEESLKNISGRNFKIFLQRITKNKLGAVAGGTIVTGILQSSSMVSLMVLAFVGAGVFTLKNALAIILGANLGTTLDSWLVASLGFEFNIEVIAYPAVFLGGILLMFFGNRKSIKYISYFLFGFSLLFIGLSFMKTSMEAQVKSFDFSKYAEMSSAVFLLVGFMITLIVQSSSVTMALTLSAIHAGAVSFPAAAAIVLGSETGTIIKIMISATGGNASKKRVVFGNLIFTIILTLIVFIFLTPILFLITDILKISNPIFGIVTFSSLINLIAIIIFLPFLEALVKFLEKFFKDADGLAVAFIGHANIKESAGTLDLFKNETEYFIHNSMLYNLTLFEIDITSLSKNSHFNAINEKKRFLSKTNEEKYEFLKQLQGELQSFYIEYRTDLDAEHTHQLNQLISAVRSSMHSVKSIKDIESNIANLKRSSKNIKFDFFIHHKKETEALYKKFDILITEPKKISFDKLQDVYNDIQKNYTSALNNFYIEAQKSQLIDLDITIAINFNRELFTSNKAMLMAVKDLLLDEKQAEDFNAILIYKT